MDDKVGNERTDERIFLTPGKRVFQACGVLILTGALAVAVSQTRPADDWTNILGALSTAIGFVASLGILPIFFNQVHGIRTEHVKWDELKRVRVKDVSNRSRCCTSRCRMKRRGLCGDVSHPRRPARHEGGNAGRHLCATARKVFEAVSGHRRWTIGEKRLEWYEEIKDGVARQWISISTAKLGGL